MTAELLRRVVSARGEFVRETPTGVVGQRDGRAYEVVLDGTDLVIRTRWSRMLPATSRRGAAQLVNDWNRDRILPALHTERTEDGIAILAVQSTSVALGMTREQLAEVIEVTLAVTGQAMAALAASVPPVPTGEMGTFEEDEGSDRDGEDPRG